MNNQVTLQDAAKIIDRLGRYFPMLVRNGSEVVNDWYPVYCTVSSGCSTGCGDVCY